MKNFYNKSWFIDALRHAHVTQRPTTIATIPVGYGDGYRRQLSNRAHVLVRGQRAPVVGRVCMDHLMVDVGAVPDARVGDEVTLIGEQGTARITTEDLAQWADTIPHEIVTAITDRCPRRYVRLPVNASAQPQALGHGSHLSKAL